MTFAILQIEGNTALFFEGNSKLTAITPRKRIGIELKGYSVILTTFFYDMNQKIQTKKLASNFSDDSNCTFTSYA